MKRPSHTPPDTSDTLPYPFPRHSLIPGSPSIRQRTIAIYVSYPHDLSLIPPTSYRRIIVQVFTQPYAALHFINLFRLTQDSSPITFKWLSHTQILTSESVLIETRNYGQHTITLEEVMEHNLTPAESQYHLPTPIARQRFAVTRPFTTTLTIDPNSPQPTPLQLQQQQQQDSSPRTRSRSSRQKLDRTGLVHVSVIATSLNITPREARQALRTSRTPKPKGGWLFPTAEVPRYTDIIRTHLKKSSTPH